MRGAAMAFLFAAALYQPARADVDVALIVAVDVSQTIDETRYRLQLEGIAGALENPDVIARILGGAHASIQFTMLTWTDRENIVIPWTRISNEIEARELAAHIRHLPQPPADFTCLTHMMRKVADKIATQIPEKADRVVLDISGDQRENCNPSEATTTVRDELVGYGVTINGLPILEGEEGPTLEDWYQENVMGGPGSFVLPAHGYEDFGRAITRKFIIEISDASSMASAAAAHR